MSEPAFRCLRPQPDGTIGCGDSWATDPRLAVPCPTCRQRAGVGCIRPSGHAGNFVKPHQARRDAAWALAPCACLAAWDRAHGAAS